MEKTHKAMQLQISQVLGSPNTLEVSFNESVRFTEKCLVGIEAKLDIIPENFGTCGLKELLKNTEDIVVAKNYENMIILHAKLSDTIESLQHNSSELAETLIGYGAEVVSSKLAQPAPPSQDGSAPIARFMEGIEELDQKNHFGRRQVDVAKAGRLSALHAHGERWNLLRRGTGTSRHAIRAGDCC